MLGTLTFFFLNNSADAGILHEPIVQPVMEPKQESLVISQDPYKIYRIICKNALTSDFVDCNDIKFEDFFRGQPDDYETDASDKLEAVKLACIWKSIVLNSLVKNDIALCDTISFNSIDVEDRENLANLLKGVCKAIYNGDVGYCNSLQDIGKTDNCTKLVTGSRVKFLNNDPSFCDIFDDSDYYEDGFKPRCESILKRNIAGCD